MKIDGCSGLLDHLKRRSSKSGEWKRTTSLASQPIKSPNRNLGRFSSFEQEFGAFDFDNVKQDKKKNTVLASFGIGKRSKSHIVSKDFNVQFVERQRTKSYITNGLPFNDQHKKVLMEETYNIKIVSSDQGIGSEAEDSSSSSKSSNKPLSLNTFEDKKISAKPMDAAVPKVYVPPKRHIRNRTMSHEVNGVFEI